MGTRKVRLGVIGTGLVFRHNHWPVLKGLEAQFEIVALCNRTIAKAESMAAEINSNIKVYSDYRQLLERKDVEAVLIAVPINSLCGITREAIQRGKHVLQENPIAVRVVDGEESIRLAKDHKVTLMVGENFRYHPEFKQAYDLAQSGIIGTPKLYRLNDLHYTYPGGIWSQTPWRVEGKHDGGYLIDGGTHIIAGMSEMVRCPVKLVHGLTASFNPELLSHQDDTLFLHLVYEGGMVGQMALGYGTIDRDARHPKVYGDRGTLVLDPSRKQIEIWPVEKNAETKSFPMETDDDFKAQWIDFYRAIVDGKRPYSTAEAALMDLRILDAGRHSATAGTTVTL